jgi:hypothetical protein
VKRSGLDDYLGIRTYYLTRALFRSVIDRCPLLDTVSTWTLVAAAGASAFVFANFDKVKVFIKPGRLPTLGWLLLISIIAGLIHKLYAARVKAVSEFDDQLHTGLKDTINSLVTRAGHVAQVPADVNLVDLQLSTEKVEEIDKQLLQMRAIAQNEFLESLGPTFSWMIKRRIEAYNKDPLYVLKIANREYFRLVMLLLVQLATLLFALAFTAFHLKFR